MGNFPLFYITDGTVKVDFFSVKSPFNLMDWTPVTALLKDSGMWQSSPFWDGRRLIATARENISDIFTIAISNEDMDSVIDSVRKLRLLLEKAVYYWTSEWQREPVYLVARGTCETNTRYAIIKGYSTPNDNNPFQLPLGGQGQLHAMGDFILNIEHGLWQNVVPGTSQQVPIKGTDCWDYPYSLLFNQTTSNVNCGSDASLDNLADNAFTAEAWVYISSYTAGGGYNYIFCKGVYGTSGWELNANISDGLWGQVYCAVTSASTHSDPQNFILDQWNHAAMTWDDAADRRIRIFVNGVPHSSIFGVGNGAIVADAANNLYIGNRNALDRTLNGYIGWSRISNFVRYGGIFQPPPRCIIPQVDAGTLGLWIHEGTGTAIDNIEGTAARDGVATGCTWHSDCCEGYD